MLRIPSRPPNDAKREAVFWRYHDDVRADVQSFDVSGAQTVETGNVRSDGQFGETGHFTRKLGHEKGYGFPGFLELFPAN